jgi:hypothetical protein
MSGAPYLTQRRCPIPDPRNLSGPGGGDGDPGKRACGKKGARATSRGVRPSGFFSAAPEYGGVSSRGNPGEFLRRNPRRRPKAWSLRNA